MDNQHSCIGYADDNVGIPDDLRCKRSDGKQWRCTAMSMPDKTVCEKHYIQAKKRAANSAMRASLKKANRKNLPEGAVYSESKSDDLDMSLLNVEKYDHHASFSGKKGKSKKARRQLSPDSPPLRSLVDRKSSKLNDVDMDDESFEDKQMSYRTPASHAMDTSMDLLQKSLDTRSTAMSSSEEQSDGDTESSEDVGGSSCHQCRRVSKEVIWCLRCDRRGYCATCIATWYQEVSLKELERICPACRGTCTCRVCSRADNLIKARVKEIPVLDKLRYLHCLLSSVLPVVKQIHLEQCAEQALEKNLSGTKDDLERTKLNADEQMCCDCCRVPIVDFHRHCRNCSYDLCLSCCQDLRDASLGSSLQTHASGEYNGEDTMGVKFHSSRNILLLGVKFPGWRANSDGSIPCLPRQHGGCGLHSLTLRRIFKLNWVGKLVKVLEEMVNGCNVKDGPSLSETTLLDSNTFQCACREESQDNFLYCPSAVDIKTEGTGQFRRHWIEGKPVIIEGVFDNSSLSSWDPMLLWREIYEITDERKKNPKGTVKVADCLDWSQVNMQLLQFISGYSEGQLRQDGSPLLLKLKDWPSPSASEDFLMYQRPELMSRLPLLEFIHSKWGLLNVAAKLPHYSLQNDAGPKILISYGIQEELGSGNSVTNLHLNMRDMVYLLVHSSEMSLKDCPKSKIGKSLNTYEDLDIEDDELIHKDEIQEGRGTYRVAEMLHNERHVREGPPLISAHSPGALWDVFRRKDVPKLTDYIYAHWNELCSPNAADSSPFQITRPLYNESVYLNSHHKMRIKEEFGIEPWSFEQHVGHAVYIPAGCPFQVRNLQSTVQVAFDFLLPESLKEAVKMSEEIRCLPNDHAAKLQMLEVGKISLYAASSAIAEVQKLVLDPKLGVELSFEDPNLTSLVSVNLEKMVKQRQVSCM